MVEYGSKVTKEEKMKKFKMMLLAGALTISLAACGGKEAEESDDTTTQEAESNSGNAEKEEQQEKGEDEMSQSEWVESYGNDKMEDGHEKVESINIDSGDTKIAYKRSERYTLESGEEVFMVYFDFSNVNTTQTTIDAHYNFSAFQDGVEITIYSLIWDEFEAAQNRDKEILTGATIEVAVAIAPDNWESPIKLRVNDDMGYDDINVVHTFQQQELNLQ